MSSSEAIRIVSLCVVLAGVETLHGIARTVWLAPRVGKALAIKLSVVSGSLLAFAVCWLLVPGIGLHGPGRTWRWGWASRRSWPRSTCSSAAS